MKKKYNVLNNSLGWLMFAVAAITYLLTMEPTASFWDCGEFIAQGYKLEVGHPPGNPIFMLAARFFINFSSDPSTVAVCVNTMSALLSAGTILLLFWTITHLTRNLLVRREDEEKMSLAQMLVIFGSGVVGSLAYTWSSTFWFSAVEGEVYAFSSFCTALVFWLILKWERRAEDADSDRYLILIAYIIGISVAVHLLNLLCIPAIVLVFYYRLWKNTNAKGSLAALLVSFGIIVLILYGLVPGFVKVAQWFELLCVNTFNMPFNSGVIVYLLIDIALFVWSIYELNKQNNSTRIKISFTLSIVFSGMLFIGSGWIIPVVLIAALVLYLFKFCKALPIRIMNIVLMSVVVIFIGYSSYALIIIRSSAQTPMDQNSPDNVFALGSYLNREQYGQTPLLYGQTFNSQVLYEDTESGVAKPKVKRGKALYAKEVKATPDSPDRYRFLGYDDQYVMSPEMDMLFPRMHSSAHAQQYKEWTGMKGNIVKATTRVDRNGNVLETGNFVKPTFLENLQFFFDYQLNYMYWRYFMWNFVGQQNDIQGNGEINHGNWVSGIPFIDNARLGDQSLMPSDLAGGNKGHNVFYMLPLLLGIIGLLWQAFADKKGIEQFWVVFFLFFMTGIAIVLYLNQTPGQPRERDYAFAGSFYAFAIWIGLGVAGLWNMILNVIRKMNNDKEASESKRTLAAAAACLLGLVVPFQMVSQTWDDHDRSGRYVARDFGMNYLSSVGPNGIIFTNGDNDTFPLWYAQEVEGYRTDVRVVNLSYLSTDWYINQMRRPAYESPALKMMANDSTFAYNNRQYNYFIDLDERPVDARTSLSALYSPNNMNNPWKLPMVKYTNLYIPVDKESVFKNNIVNEDEYGVIEDQIKVNLNTENRTGLTSSEVASLDFLTSIATDEEGWTRPVYFAMTVPDSYYLSLQKNMRSTGLAYEVVPVQANPAAECEYAVNTDKAYDNIMNKFRWGGLDKDSTLYIDETIARMITTHRSSMLDLANTLISEGGLVDGLIKEKGNLLSPETLADYKAFKDERLEMAGNVLDKMDKCLSPKTSSFGVQIGYMAANSYLALSGLTGEDKFKQKGLELLEMEILRYAEYVRYYQGLSYTPSRYNCLTRNDYYVHQTYFPGLLSLYGGIVETDQYTELLKKVEAKGVNMELLAMQLKSNK